MSEFHSGCNNCGGLDGAHEAGCSYVRFLERKVFKMSIWQSIVDFVKQNPKKAARRRGESMVLLTAKFEADIICPYCLADNYSMHFKRETNTARCSECYRNTTVDQLKKTVADSETYLRPVR